METTDLRIGNLVSYKNEDIVVVDAVSKDFILTHGQFKISTPNIEPVPLTEQWLLDFGFVKKHVDFRTQSNPTAYNGGILKLNDFTVYLDKSEIEWAYRATVLDAPKYVHQLQNLYFALTQEELINKGIESNPEK